MLKALRYQLQELRGQFLNAAEEKTYPDVGGGFVEPHKRPDPLADRELPSSQPPRCDRGES